MGSDAWRHLAVGRQRIGAASPATGDPQPVCKRPARRPPGSCDRPAGRTLCADATRPDRPCPPPDAAVAVAAALVRRVRRTHRPIRAGGRHDRRAGLRRWASRSCSCSSWSRPRQAWPGVVAVTSITALSADLPDPARARRASTSTEPTIVYDRTGKIELARFQQERRTRRRPTRRSRSSCSTRRRPPRTARSGPTRASTSRRWSPPRIENAQRRRRAARRRSPSSWSGRGCSPRTSSRPAPTSTCARPRRSSRPARLTQAFPGEAGKEQIITAYLNEIFYGHDAYGIARGRRRLLRRHRPREADAGPGRAARRRCPQSPSTLDPYRFAEDGRRGPAGRPAERAARGPPQLDPVEPDGGPLDARSRPAELAAALEEPVVLRGDRPIDLPRRRTSRGRSGASSSRSSGRRRPSRPAATASSRRSTGGPSSSPRTRSRRRSCRPTCPRAGRRRCSTGSRSRAADRGWINALRGKDLHNAALVAIDYRTGDVRAYVGSRRLLPRRPAQRAGSTPSTTRRATATASRARRSSRSSTPRRSSARSSRRARCCSTSRPTFAPAARWAPRDADQLDRGPVLVRNALQMSLNIPAIRALERVGNEAVADTAERWASFAGGTKAFLQSGLAGALGTVEVRPLDLVRRSARSATAGVHLPPRMILEVRDRDRQRGLAGARRRAERAVSAHDRVPRHRHPRRQHRRRRRTRSGPRSWRCATARRRAPAGRGQDRHRERRPRPRDLRLPRPAEEARRAGLGGRGLDGQQRPLDAARPRDPAISLTARGAAVAGVRPTADQGRPDRRRSSGPKGVVEARIDAWSGGAPGPWTRETDDGAVPRRHPAGREGRGRPRRACCTRRAAAAGWSTRSRPSSARRRGTTTSPTGWRGPGAGVGVPGTLDSTDGVLLGPLRVGRPISRARARRRSPTSRRPGPPGHDDKPRDTARSPASRPKPEPPGREAIAPARPPNDEAD